MKALVIADAHLSHPDQPSYAYLLEFLAAQRSELQLLVLLGDMVQFVTGDPKTHTEEVAPFFNAIARIRQTGTRVIWVEGNHDFCLAPYLEKTIGIEIIQNEQAIEWQGQRILLTHGDLIDRKNKGYRVLRWFLRSTFLQKLIALTPRRWTHKIAQWANVASNKRQQKGRKTLSEQGACLLQQFAQHQWSQGVHHVLCGHFHQPFQLHDGDHQLWVVGAWQDGCHYLFDAGQGWKPGSYTPSPASSS